MCDVHNTYISASFCHELLFKWSWEEASVGGELTKLTYEKVSSEHYKCLVQHDTTTSVSVRGEGRQPSDGVSLTKEAPENAKTKED